MNLEKTSTNDPLKHALSETRNELDTLKEMHEISKNSAILLANRFRQNLEYIKNNNKDMDDVTMFIAIEMSNAITFPEDLEPYSEKIQHISRINKLLKENISRKMKKSLVNEFHQATKDFFRWIQQVLKPHGYHISFQEGLKKKEKFIYLEQEKKLDRPIRVDAEIQKALNVTISDKDYNIYERTLMARSSEGTLSEYQNGGVEINKDLWVRSDAYSYTFVQYSVEDVWNNEFGNAIAYEYILQNNADYDSNIKVSRDNGGRPLKQKMTAKQWAEVISEMNTFSFQMNPIDGQNRTEKEINNAIDSNVTRLLWSDSNGYLAIRNLMWEAIYMVGIDKYWTNMDVNKNKLVQIILTNNSHILQPKDDVPINFQIPELRLAQRKYLQMKPKQQQQLHIDAAQYFLDQKSDYLSPIIKK